MIPIHICGEGGSGEKQGEKEWWEGNRRERGNGEKQRGGERREDDIKERDRMWMGEKEVGGGGGGEEGRELRGGGD